jgi:hypothetical protein
MVYRQKYSRLRSCLYGSCKHLWNKAGFKEITLRCSPLEKVFWQNLHSIISRFCDGLVSLELSGLLIFSGYHNSHSALWMNEGKR